MSAEDTKEVHFITGFPGFLAGHLVRKLLENPQAFCYLLCIEAMKEAAQQQQAKLDEGAKRTEILVGDITADDLGLDGGTLERIRPQVHQVWHLAALYNLGAPEALSIKINVEGTKNVIAFCRTLPNFVRHQYISTCYIHGKRTGLCTESELDLGQKFKNHYESTKCWAEVAVAESMTEVPTSIYRPGIVVGHSQTGEINKYDGPYYVISNFVAYRKKGKIGAGRKFALSAKDSNLYITPVDFTIGAMVHLSRLPEAEGKTFALVQPDPMSVQEFVKLVFEKFGLTIPWWRLPLWTFKLSFAIPGVPRLFGIPRETLAYYDHQITYDNTNTQKLLEGSGITCPRPTEYIDTMIDFVSKHPEIAKVGF